MGKVLWNTDSSVLSVLCQFERHFLTAESDCSSVAVELLITASVFSMRRLAYHCVPQNSSCMAIRVCTKNKVLTNIISFDRTKLCTRTKLQENLLLTLQLMYM